MKEKIGIFMIAAILSSSCGYFAKALKMKSEFEIQPRAQEYELSMNDVDRILRRWIAPKSSSLALLPQPRVHPAEIIILGPYYYDGPLDVVSVSHSQKAPQSATPYKSLSDEELSNWANSTK